MKRRPVVLILALAVLALLIAIPALAASPSAGANPSPTKASEPKPSKAPKAQNEKADEVAITLHGTISATTDPDGQTAYTLASGGTTYSLEAGPPWFFGDAYPLKPYVGKSVTITGEHAAGSTEVDVLTVDGKALREPGKPPWAGGWKVVGERHPGWSQAKADKFKAKFCDCFPPGQCKTKDKAGHDGDEEQAPTATKAPTATSVPTLAPTAAPTSAPTSAPTTAPTSAPTAAPTPTPTATAESTAPTPTP